MINQDKLRQALWLARKAIDGDYPQTLTPMELRALADAAESTLPAPKEWVIIIRRRDGQGEPSLFDHMGTKWMDAATACERAKNHTQDWPSNTYTPFRVPL